MLINGGLIARQEKLPIFGASFDGTNDYLARGAGLTGAADGKLGIFACKFKMLGGDGVTQRLASNRTTALGARFNIDRGSDNLILLRGTDTGGTLNMFIKNTTAITADGNYHTLLASWDIGTDDNHMYLDDASEISVTTSDNTNIDHTVGNFGIGADVDPIGNKLNADVNVMYLNIAEKIDLSVTANRRKFFDVNGNWVPSRYDGGQEPTGNQPIIYIPGTYRSFSANHGTGGGFIVTGAFTEPAS